MHIYERAERKAKTASFKRKAQRTIGGGLLFLSSLGTKPAMDLGQYLGLINEDAQKNGTVEFLKDYQGMVACKKHSDDDQLPQEVTYFFEIVDHMTGQGRTITKQGYTNSAMTITSAETEIAGVVPGYIAIQDPSTGEILGSGNGSMSFPTGTRTNLRAIRFHDGQGLKELYDALAAQGMRLYTKRDSAWGRKDGNGATGNESVWTDVFSQVNNALQAPFPLGSVRTGGADDFYGFDTRDGGDGGKVLSEKRIFVNPTIPHMNQIRTGLAELVEYVFMFNDINNKQTQQTICNPGDNHLNNTGVSLVRFCAGYLVDQ